jgi:hypothetical protein
MGGASNKHEQMKNRSDRDMAHAEDRREVINLTIFSICVDKEDEI